jgi:hypothetical protein
MVFFLDCAIFTYLARDLRSDVPAQDPARHCEDLRPMTAAQNDIPGWKKMGRATRKVPGPLAKALKTLQGTRK